MGCVYINKTVWSGADNAFTLELSSKAQDGTITLSDLSVVQSMTLELKGQPLLTVNKNDADAPIDWWDAGLTQGQVTFTLGQWAETAGIVPGNYEAELISYDLANTGGIVWTSHDNREMWISVR